MLAFDFVVIILFAAISFSVEITFGIAGALLFISFLSQFYDPKLLIMYSILPRVLAAGIGLFRHRVRLDWSFLREYILTSLIGIGAGLVLFEQLKGDFFQILLGIMLMLAGLALLLRQHNVKLSRPTKIVLDLLSGVTTTVFGINSTIMIIRLLSSFDHKTEIRNHALVLHISFCLAKFVGYTATGAMTTEVWQLFAYSTVPLMVIFWWTSHFHTHVSVHYFHRFVGWFVLVSGILVAMT